MSAFSTLALAHLWNWALGAKGPGPGSLYRTAGQLLTDVGNMCIEFLAHSSNVEFLALLGLTRGPGAAIIAPRECCKPFLGHGTFKALESAMSQGCLGAPPGPHVGAPARPVFVASPPVTLLLRSLVGASWPPKTRTEAACVHIASAVSISG